MASLRASIGTLASVYDLVRREDGQPRGGRDWCRAPRLLRPTRWLETALDLGRVDALFVFLLTAAIYAARAALPLRRWALLLSGCLVGLAALTKLPLGALPVALAIAIYLAVVDLRGAALFILGACVTVGVAMLLLRLQSGPWPTWYMWDLPRQHEIRQNLLGRFWFADFLEPLHATACVGRYFSSVEPSPTAAPAAVLRIDPAALLGLAWISRTSSGGSSNVLVPARARGRWRAPRPRVG